MALTEAESAHRGRVNPYPTARRVQQPAESTAKRGSAPRFAVADRLRIAYDDLGEGEPAFLLLPGWVSPRSVHWPLASWLSRERRVLLLDWRGHGDSQRPWSDFGTRELVADTLAVIGASGVETVIPVSQAHAGWVSLELVRTIRDRIPMIALLNWMVLDPPPWFVSLNERIADPHETARARDLLFARWLTNVTHPVVRSFVRERMAAADPALWRRSAREILRSYRAYGSPSRALAREGVPPRTLHVYAQPRDRAYLQAQRRFSEDHSWFHAVRLDAESIFAQLEAPREFSEAIVGFHRVQ